MKVNVGFRFRSGSQGEALEGLLLDCVSEEVLTNTNKYKGFENDPVVCSDDTGFSFAENGIQ